MTQHSVDEKSILRNARSIECEVLPSGQTQERGWILPSGHFVAIPTPAGHGVVARYLATDGGSKLTVQEAIKALLDYGVVRKASWSAYELHSSAMQLIEDDLASSGLLGEPVFLDVWFQGVRKQISLNRGWEVLSEQIQVC
jgi:hypothetical protein